MKHEQILVEMRASLEYHPNDFRHVLLSRKLLEHLTLNELNTIEIINNIDDINMLLIISPLFANIAGHFQSHNFVCFIQDFSKKFDNNRFLTEDINEAIKAIK
jgi:hypothetical protein